MEVEIQVPAQLVELASSVVVGRWLVGLGEAFLEGASVAELETDLVIVELPAPASGKLTRIVKKTGQRVGPSETLAWMEPG